MPEQMCPVCGWAVVESGYEKEGVTYCCEPCATGVSCECGCCHEAGEAEKK